jgi:preprotein translocase subunit YajC
VPASCGPFHPYGSITVKDVLSILPIVVLILVFVLLVVRPARARRQEFLSLQNRLEVGQHVMLSSGIFGELVALGDETVELRIAPDTVITVNRHAVSRINDADTEPETSTDL